MGQQPPRWPESDALVRTRQSECGNFIHSTVAELDFGRFGLAFFLPSQLRQRRFDSRNAVLVVRLGYLNVVLSNVTL